MMPRSDTYSTTYSNYARMPDAEIIQILSHIEPTAMNAQYLANTGTEHLRCLMLYPSHIIPAAERHRPRVIPTFLLV